ncbi:hypothetical protein VNO77_22482 [Canavalia gladiata]|uniref:Uncharacterized protein n=1 Tax=Canavalia gladiata TaxID=3824 RepID=A0AAN9L2V4_CANGL
MFGNSLVFYALIKATSFVNQIDISFLLICHSYFRSPESLSREEAASAFGDGFLLLRIRMKAKRATNFHRSRQHFGERLHTGWVIDHLDRKIRTGRQGGMLIKFQATPPSKDAYSLNNSRLVARVISKNIFKGKSCYDQGVKGFVQWSTGKMSDIVTRCLDIKSLGANANQNERNVVLLQRTSKFGRFQEAKWCQEDTKNMHIEDMHGSIRFSQARVNAMEETSEPKPDKEKETESLVPLKEERYAFLPCRPRSGSDCDYPSQCCVHEASQLATYGPAYLKQRWKIG